MYSYDMTKLNYDIVRFGAVHFLPAVNQSGMPYISADLIGNCFVAEFRSQSHEVTELVTCCSKWHLRFLDYSCIVIASETSASAVVSFISVKQRVALVN